LEEDAWTIPRIDKYIFLRQYSADYFCLLRDSDVFAGLIQKMLWLVHGGIDLMCNDRAISSPQNINRVHPKRKMSGEVSFYHWTKCDSTIWIRGLE